MTALDAAASEYVVENSLWERNSLDNCGFSNEIQDYDLDAESKKLSKQSAKWQHGMISIFALSKT